MTIWCISTARNQVRNVSELKVVTASRESVRTLRGGELDYSVAQGSLPVYVRPSHRCPSARVYSIYLVFLDRQDNNIVSHWLDYEINIVVIP